MKTTKRFDAAITKLYNAFHKGELDAFDCKHCAVGNICDNSGQWGVLLPIYGTTDLEYINKSVKFKMHNSTTIKTGYSLAELAMIEGLFLEKIRGKDEHDKHIQFKGLCSVVEYLCELDGIPNVTDYTKLFEYDKETV